ncbi:MAG: hypothetical protein H0T42_08700 [Deltaproteobacteria bacterium]|nr:hypothetical protein [Deltaproteobacteria bacterium]
MRILLALTFVLAACGGSSKKNVPPGTTEGSDSAAETCCCKSNPLTSEDGKPVYENGNRMECSAKQGECVPDVQCTTTAPTE